MELRVLLPDEWELWREVRLRALADAPEAFSSTTANWVNAEEGSWRQRLTEVPFNLVAIVNEVPVGQVSGTEVGRECSVELISMWVDPCRRRTGVADALVTAVKNHARQAGANSVRLSVRRLNTRAIHLYERTGFVLAGQPGDEPGEIAMFCQV